MCPDAPSESERLLFAINESKRLVKQTQQLLEEQFDALTRPNSAGSSETADVPNVARKAA